MKTLHAHVSFVAGGLETLLTFVYWSIVWYDESFVRRQRRLPGKVLGKHPLQTKGTGIDPVFQTSRFTSTPSFS